MADPLSVIGGIAAIVQISSTVINLITTFRDSSNDRKKLLAEINHTTLLCQILKGYAENDAASWTSTFQALCASDNGPFEQFRASLQYLEMKLGSVHRERSGYSPKDSQPLPLKRALLGSWVRLLQWPFTKNEVQEILANVERQKTLLGLALTNDSLRLSVAMQEGISDISIGVKNIRLNQENDQRKQALSRLSTINFETNHSDVCSKRAKGTGEWFLQSRDYGYWLDPSTNTMMWCRGIPGAGKTILASRVLDHVFSLKACDPTIGVAGLYCSYRDPQTTINLLGSLIQQLARPLSDFPISISENKSPTTEDMTEALTQVIPSYGQIFLVVDALDECPNRLDLLKHLSKLVQTISGQSLCILVTSRSGITDIERTLKADLHFEIRSHDNDVRLYLEKSLREQQYLSNWISTNPELEESIIKAILPRLSGMFLLARLYVDILAQLPTKRKVLKALETLPESIESTYADAWCRICSQKPELAETGKKVLSWILCARRPLQVQELQHALAIEKDDPELDEDGILDIDCLTSFCAGLVIIDEHSGTMSLVHPTTNEYFLKNKSDLLPLAHELLAVTCTTHLLMTEFRIEGACSMPEDFNERCRKNVFLGYAAVNWGTHVRLSGSKTSLDLAYVLLENEKARSAAVQSLVMNVIGVPERYGPEWPWLSDCETEEDTCARIDFRNSQKAVGAIHLAAYFGLIKIAESLLEDTHKVHELDSMNGTPIHWALFGNQEVMAEYLLERGADAFAQRLGDPGQAFRRWPRPEQYMYPIEIAALQNNTDAIELLLRYNTTIDQFASILARALGVALRHEHEAAVDLLLSKDDRVIDYFLPLDHVVQFGTLHMLEKLVHAGLSEDPLQYALSVSANIARCDRVSLLLEGGANINGRAPMGDSTRDDSGSEETDSSRDDSCFDETDFTRRMKSENDYYCPVPEIVSSSLGLPQTENQKLDGKKDLVWDEVPLINVIAVSGSLGAQRVNTGCNPLGCFELLISRGADINIIAERHYSYADDEIPEKEWGIYREPRGRITTPLLMAAYTGNLTMIQTLVEKGADVNFNLGRRYNALTSALHGEGFPQMPHLGEGEGLSTVQRVRATLQLLLRLGADTTLCVATDQARIDQLLGMSSEEVHQLAAIQKVISYPDPSSRSFRSRKKELARIAHGGARPELCGSREKAVVEQLLNSSEADIEEMDRERYRRLAVFEKDADSRYRIDETLPGLEPEESKQSH